MGKFSRATGVFWAVTFAYWLCGVSVALLSARVRAGGSWGSRPDGLYEGYDQAFLALLGGSVVCWVTALIISAFMLFAPKRFKSKPRLALCVFHLLGTIVALGSSAMVIDKMDGDSCQTCSYAAACGPLDKSSYCAVVKLYGAEIWGLHGLLCLALSGTLFVLLDKARHAKHGLGRVYLARQKPQILRGALAWMWFGVMLYFLFTFVVLGARAMDRGLDVAGGVLRLKWSDWCKVGALSNLSGSILGGGSDLCAAYWAQLVGAAVGAAAAALLVAAEVAAARAGKLVGYLFALAGAAVVLGATAKIVWATYDGDTYASVSHEPPAAVLRLRDAWLGCVHPLLLVVSAAAMSLAHDPSAAYDAL